MTISERREREKERRRNEIINAAETLFFVKGFEAVTLDEIAEKAELSKGTLYLYFKNKMDIYFAIACRGLELMLGLFAEAVKGQSNGLQRVRAIGEAYHRFFSAHNDYFQTVVFWDNQEIEASIDMPSGQCCNDLGNQLLAMVAMAVAEGVTDGSIRPDIHPAKAAVILWGQATGVFQLIKTKADHFFKYHQDFPFKQVEEIVAYSFDLIECSLKNKQEQGK